MRVRICPNCGGRNINPIAGGEIGLSECIDCKFRSAIFPEKEISNEEMKKIRSDEGLEK